jgi:hypothetical protein
LVGAVVLNTEVKMVAENKIIGSLGVVEAQQKSRQLNKV